MSSRIIQMAAEDVIYLYSTVCFSTVQYVMQYVDTCWTCWQMFSVVSGDWAGGVSGRYGSVIVDRSASEEAHV